MLPFGKIRLKSSRLPPWAFRPTTLGQHLKKRRRELGLFQRQAAEHLSVGEFTYLSWEKDRKVPWDRYMPAIISFLGYDPYPGPTTLSERLKAKRRQLGLSIAAAAEHLGVDEGTFGGWERENRKPLPRHAEVVVRFLSEADPPGKIS